MLSSNTCDACNASLDNLSDDIGNSSYAVVIMPNNQSVEIGELVNSVTDSSTVGDNDRALGDPWPPDIQMSYALAYKKWPSEVLSDDLLSSGSESLVSLPSPVPKVR